MGGWICGSWMVTSMYLLFLITSWQMWGACSLRQRQANSCVCQGDSDRNKIRSMRFSDLATSYLYWPPLHLLSVHLLLCLFLMWHQVEVSSAPHSPYLPLVPPFLSCAPLSHAVHLSAAPYLDKLPFNRGAHWGERSLSFCSCPSSSTRWTQFQHRVCVKDGWDRGKRGKDRSLFISFLCHLWRSLKFPTIGWDECVWPHVCVNHRTVWE